MGALSANLLINNKGILQIADFGLARNYEGPTPLRGKGGGEATREYTTLVVTRWYRPPELLLQLRRYTTAIDMWGAGCVFGEMFKRKPILSGSSDLNQAHIIFDLVGSPNEETMPGWSSLPGCEGTRQFAPRIGNLAQVFRDQHPEAISLLKQLLMLDWRKRITAVDALEHPYFKVDPTPCRPEDIPRFPDSHEMDRRNARGANNNRQALPPAPAGGTVGMDPDGTWNGHGPPNGHGPWLNGDRPPRSWANDQRGYQAGPPGYSGTYQGYNNRIPPGAYDSRGPPSGPPPPRRQPWNGANEHQVNNPYASQRHGLPPRPPDAVNQALPRGVRERGGRDGRDQGGRGPPRNDIDSYVPSYSDGGRAGDRRSGERDDRPPSRDDRDRRPAYRDPDAPSDRRDYGRSDRRSTRSRSPNSRERRDVPRDRGAYQRR